MMAVTWSNTLPLARIWSNPPRLIRAGFRLLGTITIVAASVLCASCREDSHRVDEQGNVEIGTYEFEQGLGSVSFAASGRELTTADRLTLTFEVKVPESAKRVAFDAPHELGEWRISRQSQPELALAADGSKRGSGSVVLEPFLPGEFEMPAWSVTVDLNAPQGLNSTSIQTDPFPVTVTSVLEQGAAVELSEIKSVVDPPPPDRTRLWTTAGVVAAVVLGALSMLVRSIRARLRERVIRWAPAHELALAHVRELLQSAPWSVEQLRGVYDRAAAILRSFIENRYGLHAPERTTEEFLHESRASMHFRDEDIALLERFLTYCDLVKFAGQTPTSTDAERAIEVVRDFIQRSASADVLVMVTEEEARNLSSVEIERVDPRARTKMRQDPGQKPRSLRTRLESVPAGGAA